MAHFRYRNNFSTKKLDQCGKICIGQQKNKTVIPAVLNTLCSDISVKICEYIIN